MCCIYIPGNKYVDLPGSDPELGKIFGFRVPSPEIPSSDFRKFPGYFRVFSVLFSNLEKSGFFRQFPSWNREPGIPVETLVWCQTLIFKFDNTNCNYIPTITQISLRGWKNCLKLVVHYKSSYFLHFFASFLHLIHKIRKNCV